MCLELEVTCWCRLLHFEEPDGVRVKSTMMIEVSDSGCIVKQLKMSAHR